MRLVVFDVDGTLYAQCPLQWRMACDMVVDAVRRRDIGAIRVVTTYRRLRETLGKREIANPDHASIADTARKLGVAPDMVRAVAAEWIERRPLRYLPAYRYPGVAELFVGLRQRGTVIGVFSDYPAHDKLAALGLAADHVVCAGDAEVGFLKPHPRGLQRLMAAAGVAADETVLIGDRVGRDGLAARRAGVRALIRSRKPIRGWQTFAAYDDPLFAPLRVSL